MEKQLYIVLSYADKKVQAENFGVTVKGAFLLWQGTY